MLIKPASPQRHRLCRLIKEDFRTAKHCFRRANGIECLASKNFPRSIVRQKKRFF
jgi:hypothetical protein